MEPGWCDRQKQEWVDEPYQPPDQRRVRSVSLQPRGIKTDVFELQTQWCKLTSLSMREVSQEVLLCWIAQSNFSALGPSSGPMKAYSRDGNKRNRCGFWNNNYLIMESIL